MPRHSIIIPCYNQARFLGYAIESALRQTERDLELIVVDDGSTDESAALAARYEDPRIAVIRQENRGLPAARNAGLERSSGSALTFLDADDLLEPRNLECLGSVLRKTPEIGMVCGVTRHVDADGRALAGGPRNTASEGLFLLFGNPFGAVGACMVRRTALAQVGGFDESLVSGEDWDLWLRLALAGYRFHRIDTVACVYRHHGSQMTRDAERMREGHRRVLDELFERDDLPAEWMAERARAYGSLYVASAARWFLAGDGESGARDLVTAAEIDSRWVEDEGAALADRLTGWAFSPRCRDPLAFLEVAYANLPDAFAALRAQRRSRLAAAARQAAAEAFVEGRAGEVRSFLLRAVRYAPSLVFDRGVLSPLLRGRFRGLARS